MAGSPWHFFELLGCRTDTGHYDQPLPLAAAAARWARQYHSPRRTSVLSRSASSCTLKPASSRLRERSDEWRPARLWGSAGYPCPLRQPSQVNCACKACVGVIQCWIDVSTTVRFATAKTSCFRDRLSLRSSTKTICSTSRRIAAIACMAPSSSMATLSRLCAIGGHHHKTAMGT